MSRPVDWAESLGANASNLNMLSDDRLVLLWRTRWYRIAPGHLTQSWHASHSTVRAPARFVASGLLLAMQACASTGPAAFPPAEPDLVAENQAVGDPYAGRFPFEDAVAGMAGAGQLRAAIETSAGTIHCDLRPDQAPLTVANFVGLARGVRPFFDNRVGKWIKAPYYDGTAFHRAQGGQFVQGGRRDDEASPGYRVQDEYAAGDAFDRAGLLALANRESPHSGAAEFFITAQPIRDLDGKYTIFGRCEEVWVVSELAEKVEDGEEPTIVRVEIEYADD